MSQYKKSQTKVPVDLVKSLASNPAAKAVWNDLTPIAQRDFISWIVSAKQSETRARRIERACDMLIKGKRRPCCYSIVPMDLYKALGFDPKAKAAWRALASDEKRDFIDRLEARPHGNRKEKIEKALKMLALKK
jgi:uncharacterized protein YdeI (YjbR/CyaY-like superfamily)